MRRELAGVRTETPPRVPLFREPGRFRSPRVIPAARPAYPLLRKEEAMIYCLTMLLLLALLFVLGGTRALV